ncbi:YfhO family protein [Loigolactobacillus coryniformis subsp. coryniformis]|uniref:YfhO family protein n=1 Tax=Loigolactobacillus coryniformis TaxID=1610 RepID=UPI003995BD13
MRKSRKSGRTIIEYLSAFALPILIMLLVFCIKGVFPFGGRTPITSDLNNQYISFFAYFKNHINNLHDLFYSFSLSIGGNFFGIFTYYLISPLNLLVLLLPVAKLPIAITIIMLIKTGLLGVSMLYYLEYHSKVQQSEVVELSAQLNVFLAISFALMSYQIGYMTNLMWTDTIILLPIVILGLEKIMHDERPYVYIAALFFAILFNYYIGFMVCLFVAIYYVYQLLLNKFKLNITIREQLRGSFFKLLISSVVGVGLSAITLLPGLRSVPSLKSNSYHFQLAGRFQPLDLFHQFYSGIQADQLYPYFYGGMLAIVLCFLYFASKKITLPEKITSAGFLSLLLMSQIIEGTYQMWHGFNSPNGMANRNAFLFTFFLIVVAVEALSAGVLKLTLKQLTNLVLIYTLSTFVLGKFSSDILTVPVIIVNLALFVGTITSIYYLKAFKSVSLLILLILVSVDLGFNAYRQSYVIGIQTKSFTKYTNQVNAVLKQLPDNQRNFYRIGTTFERSNDDPLLFDYYGLSNYNSAESPETINFLQKLGYFQNHNWWRWTNFNNGSTFMTDSLLGVKYVIHNNSRSLQTLLNEAGSQLGGYNLNYIAPYRNNIYTHSGYTVYQNKYALSLTNLVSNRVLSADEIHRDTSASPFKYLNQVFNQVTDTTTPIYRAIPVTTTDSKQAGRYDYQVQVNKTGQLYFYLPTSNITKNGIDDLQDLNTELYVNGRRLSKINVQQQNGITALGDFKAGQAVDLSIRTENNTVDEINALKPLVYREDSAKVAAELIKIKQNKVQQLKVSASEISFVVKADQTKERQTVMLSLPYDTGWQAFENGRQIKIKRALDGLMAVQPTGNTTNCIVLKYIPAGLKLGTLVTIGSLAILITYVGWLEFKQRRS